MKTIQQKIWMLVAIVLSVMIAIWLTLTFYNQKTQDQYNDILQRYLEMNEVTNASQLVITDLNNFLIDPSNKNESKLNNSTQEVFSAQKSVADLRNVDNDFILTSYINLIDSFIETVERSVTYQNAGDADSSVAQFSEANRISNYISEMTLLIIDSELKSYELFYRDIIKKSDELNQLGIWLLLLMTSFLLFLAYLFSLSITRPIHQLRNAADELSKGRFEMPIKVDSNDEISFLARTFDNMRVSINKLFDETQLKAQLEMELQENKLLLQESQLRILQSQINPHFLFNTLNTLSKKAYLEGSEETSDLLVNVAGLFRYNLKRMDRPVTLYEEVVVLKQYMEIQKARFPDRLYFHLEVDESCLHFEMPGLTLQPLIENAVIHAIEPLEEGGHIWFRIVDHGDIVRIEIEDSGGGMSLDKRQQLLDGAIMPENGHSTGIGFSNVMKRLTLFYGIETIVSIESEEGSGTKIILQLPKTGGIGNADETIDR